DREGTAARLERAAARPPPRMTSHDAQADPGQAVPEEAFAPPPEPARTVSPAGRPGPHPASGRDGPQRAQTHVAAPGPGTVRAGGDAPRRPPRDRAAGPARDGGRDRPSWPDRSRGGDRTWTGDRARSADRARGGEHARGEHARGGDRTWGSDRGRGGGRERPG